MGDRVGYGLGLGGGVTSSRWVDHVVVVVAVVGAGLTSPGPNPARRYYSRPGAVVERAGVWRRRYWARWDNSFWVVVVVVDMDAILLLFGLWLRGIRIGLAERRYM